MTEQKIEWEYPCGFVLVGTRLESNYDSWSQHTYIKRSLVLNDTVLLGEGIAYTFNLDIWGAASAANVDHIFAQGPCIIKSVAIGTRLPPVGMQSKFVEVNLNVQVGELIQITIECRPELFRLRKP